MGVVTGTLSADGSSSIARKVGGRIGMLVAGTFGSGTAALNISYDNGTTWAPASGASLTAAGMVVFEVPKSEPCDVKIILTGATGPSLSYWIVTQ